MPGIAIIYGYGPVRRQCARVLQANTAEEVPAERKEREINDPDHYPTQAFIPFDPTKPAQAIFFSQLALLGGKERSEVEMVLASIFEAGRKFEEEHREVDQPSV